MDKISPVKRSWQMAQVRRTNTAPELLVRKLAHRLGYRFRLHDRRLPGSPDIVFRSRRKVIFVHGCFWHRHDGCKLASMPKTNVDFWGAKFDANKARDQRVIAALHEMGWDTLTIWQCEAGSTANLESRLRAFLDG